MGMKEGNMGTSHFKGTEANHLDVETESQGVRPYGMFIVNSH